MTYQKATTREIDELLTVQDVAGRLNISVSLVYKLITNGEIKSVRFGGAVRVMSTDLEAYVQSSRSSHQQKWE